MVRVFIKGGVWKNSVRDLLYFVLVENGYGYGCAILFVTEYISRLKQPNRYSSFDIAGR